MSSKAPDHRHQMILRRQRVSLSPAKWNDYKYEFQTSMNIRDKFIKQSFLGYAHISSTSYVSMDGTKTNTPELKQSGHPGSGAAESSSRSKSSSQFCTT